MLTDRETASAVMVDTAIETNGGNGPLCSELVRVIVTVIPALSHMTHRDYMTSRSWL